MTDVTNTDVINAYSNSPQERIESFGDIRNQIILNRDHCVIFPPMCNAKMCYTDYMYRNPIQK
jgi:hypothetical protein